MMSSVVISRSGLLCTIVAAVTIIPVAGTAGEAGSQNRPAPGADSPVYLLMLCQPPVQQDLRLSASQIDTISSLMEDFTASAQTAFTKAKQSGGRPIASLPSLLAEESAEVTKRIAEILSEGQLQRLEQLHLRAARVWVLFQPDVREELDLSSKTLADARAILHASESKCAEAAREIKTKQAKREDTMARIDQLRLKAHEEVFSLLTPSQQLRLERLLGPEPDFEPSKLRLRLVLMPPEPSSMPETAK